MRRARTHTAQRPTRDASSLGSGPGWREVTLAGLKSGEDGQREAEALEKLFDSAHGCLVP